MVAATVMQSQEISNLARWLDLAERGDETAQCILGEMYAVGYGVIKESATAVMWFRKAAEQGNARAQNSLGDMYAKGEGVTRDSLIALIWYLKAAERGNANAQFNLGAAYASGEGVVKDLVEAHSWYNLAGANGHSQAHATRITLERVMTSEEITRATDLARARFGAISQRNSTKLKQPERLIVRIDVEGITGGSVSATSGAGGKALTRNSKNFK